jgi:hypothetical protein
MPRLGEENANKERERERNKERESVRETEMLVGLAIRVCVDPTDPISQLGSTRTRPDS